MEGLDLVETTFEGLSDLSEEAALAANVSLGLSIFRWASRALVALALLAEIGTLIYDGIEGKKQMDKLRG